MRSRISEVKVKLKRILAFKSSFNARHNAGYWSNRSSMNGGRPPETVSTWWKESRFAHHIENLVLIQSHVTLTDDLSEVISAPDYVTVGLIVILNPSDQRLWRSSTIHRTTFTPVTSVLFHGGRQIQPSHEDISSNIF